MSEMQKFFDRFGFKPDLTGFVGIERERFLLSPNGRFAPRADVFLGEIRDPAWTYELSRCQVEDRTSPAREQFVVKANLLANDNRGKITAERIGLSLRTFEVAPSDLPTEVYPVPRYLGIAKSLDAGTLSAACRVAGTHIHFGVGSIEQAIDVHNALRAKLDDLVALGDHSNGTRIDLYKKMAANWEPPIYESPEHFFQVARSEGFSQNTRNCWHLIRITQKGTVECRMFGATEFPDEVLEWVATVKHLVNGNGERI